MARADKTDTARNPASRRDVNASATWRDRYGERHRLRRLKEMPAGIRPPQRVRVYERRDHFVLQWWDKREKRTLSERVDGDLLSALSRAREIDDRLANFKTSGKKAGRCGHTTVVVKFLEDLERRASAGEIDVATVSRYTSALERYYLPFAEQPDVGRRYRHVGLIDRNFQLELAAYLGNIQVSPNGHPHARPRPLKQPAFVMDVVRAMLEWAADPDRGNLLADGFRNPFVRRGRESRKLSPDLLAKPDISLSMAVALIEACDRFQLGIFGTLALYGLRPGELGWLFRENATDDWLRVRCLAQLDYATKGRRDKSFPIIPCLRPLWHSAERPGRGLLFVNRRVADGTVQPALLGKSLSQLVDEYHRRCAPTGQGNAGQRRRLRDELMNDAGRLSYDHVEHEFRKLARGLNWPREATLKDLRHLFATSLENAGVPEFYRRYLMGQSFGHAPIVAYTHVTEDQVKRHFEAALSTELGPLVGAIERRSQSLER